MSGTQLPRVVWVYLAATAVQVTVAATIVGAGTAFAGAAALLFCVGGLAYGQRWAWLMLAGWNAFAIIVPAIAIGSVAGSGNHIRMDDVWEVASSACLLALLLSKAMRNHITARSLLDSLDQPPSH